MVEDPTEQLMVDGEVLRDVEHMDSKKSSDKMHLRNYIKRGSATVVVEMKTTRTMGSLKYDNFGSFVKWLNEARVFIQLNKWAKEAYTSIGFFVMRYPTMT